MVNCLLFKIWLVALLIKVCLADLGYYRIWLFVFANLLCCLVAGYGWFGCLLIYFGDLCLFNVVLFVVRLILLAC